MKFWNMSRDGDCAVLRLDGVISEGNVCWADEKAVTPKQFREDLKSIAGCKELQVYINSPGGDCTAASQIYTMLKEFAGKVIVKIDGLAASAASVIAMSGDEVCMAPTALMMIHDPWTLAIGNAGEFQSAINVLDEVKESIINAYEQKTKLSRGDIANMMTDETWLSAKKALELGFIDTERLSKWNFWILVLTYWMKVLKNIQSFILRGLIYKLL